MLPNIVLHIGWIVHHSRKHRYGWYDATVYNGCCPGTAGVDEASLRLEHVEADEQICFTVGYDCRYLGSVLGVVDVGGYCSVSDGESFLVVELYGVAFLGACSSER